MLKRIITGVVALPVVIFLIHQGGYLFDAAVFALATVGLFELRNMARANGHDIYWLSTGITAICLIYTASVFRVISIYSFILLPAFLMLGCILVLLEGMARHHNDGKWAFNTALSVMAVVYIGFGFAHFILLRDAMYFTSADLQVSLWGLPIDRGEILFWVVLGYYAWNMGKRYFCLFCRFCLRQTQAVPVHQPQQICGRCGSRFYRLRACYYGQPALS